MQNDQIYSEITNLILTKDDLNELNKELNLLEESLYEPKVSFEEVLKKTTHENLEKLVLELLKTNSKEAVIKEIKKRLSLIKFVNLTLSFDPTYAFMEKISSWFAKSVNQTIALDIKIDPKLIGGAIVEYEGKYFDNSIKNKLESILKNYV
jgi:F0F1-type ATP synthase delta subunit